MFCANTITQFFCSNTDLKNFLNLYSQNKILCETGYLCVQFMLAHARLTSIVHIPTKCSAIINELIKQKSNNWKVFSPADKSGVIAASRVPQTRECVQVSGTPILNETIRSDSVYKCHASVPDRFSTLVFCCWRRRAGPRARSMREIEGTPRACIRINAMQTPCKLLQNPISFFRSTRARTLPSIPSRICTNAWNAVDDIDAFPLVTHARDRRHKNSRKRMGFH